MLEVGKVQAYIGYGKGKTTAGLGLVLRALGQGLGCAIVFFDKGGNDYGERRMLELLSGHIGPSEHLAWYAFGRDRRTEEGVFDFSNKEIDFEEAKRGLAKAKELLGSGNYQLVFCDEFLSCCFLTGLLPANALDELLASRPAATELILTGHKLPEEYLDRFDLITLNEPVKHYADQGVEARRGIEY